MGTLQQGLQSLFPYKKDNNENVNHVDIKSEEEPFTLVVCQKALPGYGYDRYATAILYRSQDRKYWTDADNFHKYVIDDYGFLKYVGWQGQNN